MTITVREARGRSTRPDGHGAAPRVIKRKMPKWHVKRAHHADWPQPEHPPDYTVCLDYTAISPN